MRYELLAGAALGLGLGLASVATAGPVQRDPQDPAVGGQLNRCWGEVASQIAKLEPTAESGIKGGGMGAHSRDPNGQGSTFFENFIAAPDVRLGIGNATGGVDGPHGVEPGDGGIGEHAINNGSSPTGLALVTVIDPLTGEFNFAGTGIELTCSLDDGSLVRNENGNLVIP